MIKKKIYKDKFKCWNSIVQPEAGLTCSSQILSSGMNYQKRGLKHLLEQIMNAQIGRLVLTHKDRLLRFGAELVFSLCAVKHIEVVIINQGDEPTFEEELAKDVLEIITVFSARLYGARSHKNKQLIANLQAAVTNV
jgi:predicted site-specific integrase-resolvase